jgi:hypothetical protein
MLNGTTEIAVLVAIRSDVMQLQRIFWNSENTYFVCNTECAFVWGRQAVGHLCQVSVFSAFDAISYNVMFQYAASIQLGPGLGRCC